jgi:hypothetical protein
VTAIPGSSFTGTGMNYAHICFIESDVNTHWNGRWNYCVQRVH